MVQWQQQADLSQKNSFGFNVTAERYAAIETIEQLESALTEVETHNWPLLILGGGSNLVLQSTLPGAVISIAQYGVRVLADNETEAIVEVGAGENWHQFIGQLLNMGLHGLENLALIPGSVGAAPVQNIGAYGVELADCFHSLTAYDRKQKTLVQLDKDACGFGYRDSLFKSGEPGRYIIWQVRFRLSSRFTPDLSYRGLGDYFADHNISQPNAHDLYKAVCEIRQSKLPNPTEIGNAGSFFENPIVSAETYQRLQAQFPNLIAYPESQGGFKLAAGWLIDQAGWKGHQADRVGVYNKQALVLVNLGQGDAEQLLQLAQAIQASVHSKFGVKLKIEPRVYPELQN